MRAQASPGGGGVGECPPNSHSRGRDFTWRLLAPAVEWMPWGQKQYCGHHSIICTGLGKDPIAKIQWTKKRDIAFVQFKSPRLKEEVCFMHPPPPPPQPNRANHQGLVPTPPPPPHVWSMRTNRFLWNPGRPENCSAGRGVTWTPAEGGGGGLEKRGSVSGPLFCVRTDVGAEGAGTQILARKSFFHQ